MSWRELRALVIELPDDSALTRAEGGHRLTDVLLDLIVMVVSAQRAEFVAANSKKGSKLPQVLRPLEVLHPKPPRKVSLEEIAASFGVLDDGGREVTLTSSDGR